tara:strand:- start:1008 stop:1694 length:687 start_codon:yes stop_codon:yes gene_type:complete
VGAAHRVYDNLNLYKDCLVFLEMEYDVDKKEIVIDKELNILDKFTLMFVEILQKHIDYVLVSGYVSILLGRSRSSEDVDLLVPSMDFSNFVIFFNDLMNRGYECANTSNVKEAYDMLSSHAIRFYEKDRPLPNMEFKVISNEIHQNAFDNRISVVFGDNKLFISPLELQIAYKLSLMADGNVDELSSDKDFEDAKHLYELFKGKLNNEEMLRLVSKFRVEDKWNFLKQ